MDRKLKQLFLSIIFFSSFVATNLVGQITDIIPAVKVTPGKRDTILISDLFYSKAYDLTFHESDRIAIAYDPKNNSVVFQPKNNFVGATLVEFTLQGNEYSIPVIVRDEKASQQMHTFSYKPAEAVSKVVVSGTFNNWNKEKDQLIKAAGDSLYRLTIPLDPGNYLYKLIVDGKEMLDPANQEKSPTGFDNFNSVLRVIDIDTTKIFLHIGERNNSKNNFTFSFIYENTTDHAPVKQDELSALLDNKTIEPDKIILNGNEIDIWFKKSELQGEKILRVFVSREGKTSNIQQVVLHDGNPAGNSTTNWSWYDAEIYSIMIDRFYDGDKSNDKPVVHDSLFRQANYQGGDFRGIIKIIDEGYFNKLGVNTLWISPVNDNPDAAFQEYPPPHRWYSGYHGYWPISEKRVEEKFGNMKDLRELITQAHRHHMKVLLDFVSHHVHIDHPFYKQHPEWFGTLDLPDGRKNLRLWDEYRLTTWFEPYMPSFDFIKSHEALEVVSDNAVWWLMETGADGFRHDAVKHVPNNFWRTLTRKLKEKIELPWHKKVFQIGETFGDYDLIASYVNNGQLSAQFNFNLSYFAIPVFLEPGRSFSSIDLQMKKSFSSFGYNNLMGNIMDSHDKVRYMAYADGKVKDQGVDTREMAWNNPPTVDHPLSYKKAELYLAYMFTIPGLPVIYYGSEFGMTGADDPDNRRMMRFGDQLTIYEKQMLEVTKQIVKIRNEHPALRYGDFLSLQADTSVYIYIRSDMNERMLVLLNKTEQAQSIEIQLPEIYHSNELLDVVSNEKIKVLNSKVRVPIPPIGWRVFKMTNDE